MKLVSQQKTYKGKSLYLLSQSQEELLSPFRKKISDCRKAGCLSKEKNVLQNGIVLTEKTKSIFEEYVLVQTFNNHYVNIPEKSCKIKLQPLDSLSCVTDDQNVVNKRILIIKVSLNQRKPQCYSNKSGSQRHNQNLVEHQRWNYFPKKLHRRYSFWFQICL